MHLQRRTLMTHFAPIRITGLAIVLLLGIKGAFAICPCGDGICGGFDGHTCNPPETSSTCPEDCGGQTLPAACAPGAVPGPDEAVFFTDANFQGTCQIKKSGEYRTSSEIGLPNDSISSFRVGGNVQVILCRDIDFLGYCLIRAEDENFFNPLGVGNDEISSLKVQPRGTLECPPASDQAAFFMHPRTLAPCTVKGVGRYSTLGAIGLPNDSISSILVGKDVDVVICVDVDFLGDCSTIRGPNRTDLESFPIDDKISSVIVRPK
jgi:hypothetical protein